MLCRKCGAEVSAGTPFCPRCGSTMEENYVNNNSYGNTQYSNQSYSGYENNSNGNMYGGQQRLNQPYTGYENNRNNYENRRNSSILNLGGDVNGSRTCIDSSRCMADDEKIKNRSRNI